MPSMVREGKAITIRLNKDLVREVKRGHAWLYSNAVEGFHAPAGTVATVLDRKGDKRIASGICDPDHPIPVRVCRTQPPFILNDEWLSNQLRLATNLRQSYFDSATTGFRLVAGEGDGLPGLIVDVYSDTAVMKLDGGAPQAFYKPAGIANWLQDHLEIRRVVLRSRERGRAGEDLLDTTSKTTEQRSSPSATVDFLENGLKLTADVIHGQKTGFFLDQRDNRKLVRKFSKGKKVLNLFSFNGGFSVAAGKADAQHVTSVDIASPAIQAAERHWEMNELSATKHEGVAEDCFQYLEDAIKRRETWDIVICDPPSFAPSEKSKPQALAAYARLAQLAAKVTCSSGLLALASCSSHVNGRLFLETNVEALGRARRKANLLAENGLPIDHPTPMAMPELRYLKFHLFQLD